MKKVYIRPEFSCLSIEIERILESSLQITNQAETGEDMVQGYNDSDWDEN